MSCLILDDKVLSSITDFVCACLNYSSEYFTGMWDIPKDDLKRVFADCKDNWGFYQEEKVFDVLLNLNCDSYENLYTSHKAHEREFYKYLKGCRIHKVHDAQKYVIEDWHYQMYKWLDCYLYNSDNALGNDSTITFKTITKLQDALGRYIICRNEKYKNARWCDYGN